MSVEGYCPRCNAPLDSGGRCPNVWSRDHLPSGYTSNPGEYHPCLFPQPYRVIGDGDPPVITMTTIDVKELTRLRAQLADVTAERDRMKGALEKINIFGWPEKYINDTEQIVYELVDIARAALRSENER